jgi:hypothetical protein
MMATRALKMSAPATEKWRDLSSESHPAVFKMDDSKAIQWTLAKKEIEHVRYRARKLISKTQENDESISFGDIAMHSLADSMPLSEGFVLSDGKLLIEELIQVDRTMLIDGIILTDGTPFNEGWVLIEGIALRNGTMLVEGLVLTDGMPLSEGFVLTDGKLLIEGLVLTDGFILTDGTPLNEGRLLIEEIALRRAISASTGRAKCYVYHWASHECFTNRMSHGCFTNRMSHRCFHQTSQVGRAIGASIGRAKCHVLSSDELLVLIQSDDPSVLPSDELSVSFVVSQRGFNQQTIHWCFNRKSQVFVIRRSIG